MDQFLYDKDIDLKLVNVFSVGSFSKNGSAIGSINHWTTPFNESSVQFGPRFDTFDTRCALVFELVRTFNIGNEDNVVSSIKHKHTTKIFMITLPRAWSIQGDHRNFIFRIQAFSIKSILHSSQFPLQSMLFQP